MKLYTLYGTTENKVCSGGIKKYLKNRYYVVAVEIIHSWLTKKRAGV
jgi:hypothetical protein